MKILFSSDWHADVSNLDRCQIIVDQMVAVLRGWGKKQPRYVIHLGDIKEKTNPVDQRVTNFIISALAKLQSECDGFYFVKGNHDAIQTHDGAPSCTPVLDASGAYTAEHYWTRLSLGRKEHLFLVPYCRDLEQQRKMFREAQASALECEGFRMLAFHAGLDGCQHNAHKRDSGGLTLKDIGSGTYDLCVGGHIHRAQQYARNVLYVGSPFCQDWNEVNEPKYLTAVYVNNGIYTVETIPSKVPGWYDPAAPDCKIPDNWQGCHVRFKVLVEKDPVKELNEVRQRLSKKYAGAVLHLIPEFAAAPAPDAIDIRGGDEQLIRRYLEKLALPPHTSVDQVADYLKKFLPNTGLFGVQGLKFLDVHATEVLSFPKVELDLTRKGLTLITGRNEDWAERVSNGAGKSNLVSLPFIGLFGCTFKGQQHDGWARQHSKDPCGVGTRTQLPDGSILRVVRGRRPPNLRLYQKRDGVERELTMGTPAQTQAAIERITNLTWDVLTNAVYIGQSEIGSVFGTDKERKELFNRLQGLDRFLEAQEKLRKIVLRRQRACEATGVEISTASAAIEVASVGLEEIKSELKLVPQVDDKVLAERLRRIGDLQAAVQAREKENTDLEPALNTNQTEYEKFLFKAADIESRLRQMREQVEDLQSLKDVCPRCGAKVSPKSIEEQVRALKAKMEENERVLENYEDLQRKNRTVRQAMNQKRQVNDAQNRKDNLLISSMKVEVAQIQEQVEARKRLETLVARKEAYIANLERIHKVHEAAFEFCCQEKEFVEVCAQAVGRDGLPAYLCALAIPQLNAAAARYSELFANGEICVQFEIVNGSIDVSIRNLHGGKNIKDQSRGEMRVAGLITAFAFREILVPHNLLILDEPGEGLDGTNAVTFARGLNQVVPRFGSVFVISHNERMLSALEPDYTIEVVKKDGVSTIAYV